MRRGAGGMVLVSAGICVIAGLSLLGLAVDVARLWVVRSEIQAYADSAARAAALELDGTAQGMARAVHAVAANSRRWNLAASLFGGVEAEFAASAAGPWEPLPGVPGSHRFVRVRATGVVPLVFLPVVGAGRSGRVNASAVAGHIAD